MSYPMEPSEAIQAEVERLVPNPPPNPLRKLAILGNGFDLAVGRPSGFADFRRHFQTVGDENYAAGDDVLINIFHQLERVAGPEWNNFESGLADLDLPREVADMDYPDEGDLSEYSHLAGEGAYYADTLRYSLSNAFTDWVRQLPGPTRDPSHAARALVDDSDGIVTFNYTNTLEDSLGVSTEKILHVHGQVDGASQLYFGCPPIEDQQWRTGGSNALTEAVREQTLAELLDKLVKQPRLDLLDAFLARCGTLDSIGTYGFSFGEADHPYVKHIIENWCDSRTVWTNYCRSTSGDVNDSPCAVQFREVLDEFSFQGDIVVSHS